MFDSDFGDDTVAPPTASTNLFVRFPASRLLRPAPPIARDELDGSLAQAEAAFRALHGARVFLTGGTGFFGAWLLESLGHAIVRLGLDLSVVALTRRPDAARLRMPHLANEGWLQYHRGDVRDFVFPEGEFSHVIHAATSTHGPSISPQETLATIADGTTRVLDFCSTRGWPKLLYTSSGAVYGRQPETVSHLAEDFLGALDCTDPTQAYGEGKRFAEMRCVVTHPSAVIARGFAFLGAHLPLDAHFAVGNFLHDALRRSTVVVQSDGTPRRSYLHGTDLAAWLWVMMAFGANGRAYNLGSDDDHSLAEVAERVGMLFQVPVEVRGRGGRGGPRHRYVPNVHRARSELGLQVTVNLDEALLRTARWWKTARGSEGVS